MNTGNTKQLATAAAASLTGLGPMVVPIAVGGPPVWAGAALVGGLIWLAAKESSN